MNLNLEASTLVDPLADLLGYQLRRASAVMMADLGRSLEAAGLRPSEATALLLIDANPGCTQSDVGKFLGIQRANMVPLIAALLDHKVIRRSPVDGRTHALFLTQKGHRLREIVRAAIEAHEARFRNAIKDDELTSLIATLRSIRRCNRFED